MELIRKAMRKDLENDKTLMSKWATVAGLKNPNPLYDFLNHDGKTFSEFSTLVNIVKSQYPDREYELMENYCLMLDPKTKAARSALEYADANSFNDLTDKLIDKMSISSNLKSKEYGKIYGIHRKLSKGEIDVLEATKNIGKQRIKTDEMNIFSKMISMYDYLSKGNFSPMKPLLKQINLNEIKENKYLKKSFETRIHVLLSNMYLNENKLELCREYANKAIQSTSTKRFLVFSYLTIGTSYIFSDYNLSRQNYLSGYEISKGNNVFEEFFKRNLSFLNNYWNKENSWINYDSDAVIDVQEVIFELINQRKLEKALTLLNGLETKKQNENELGFHYYLEGLITNDKEAFYKSIEYFKLSQDKLFIKMPLIKLENMGENPRLLKIISM
ncbi:AimR family lysis-lysogeny pheromone receptor [Bacillus atrophaeus]|uniref:AimR family lysis-lysogeny pheromone receptor n=1 Tax=Bacillus atrophaeus TaxID=1452 RepID=UPI00227E2C6B|nr:AimR family lysis-lysogeny pheromone receptor [Bacillus atrophaeus]MCY9166775.1 AimR family lysis-lysogeny pheromone receptor [Bacillus atrophaeus]